MKNFKHLLVFALIFVLIASMMTSCDLLAMFSNDEDVKTNEGTDDATTTTTVPPTTTTTTQIVDPDPEPDPKDEGFILIYTAEELLDVIAKLNSGEIANDAQIRLKDDIDLEGIDFTPIYEFRGLFDGNEHIISNIVLPLNGATISLTDGNWVGYTVTSIGFFGSAYDATITNLTLENVTANYETNKEIFVGALVGYTEGLIVENCFVNSTFDITVTHESVGVRNISGVAGLIGYSLDAHVENTEIDTTIDYTANSYEAFAASVLGVGNVRVQSCTILLDISFTGDRYGHTGSIIGMERTPENIRLACMYDSIVSGTLNINNPYGYAWGAVGQGYLYDPDTREFLDLEAHNSIDVTITME